MLPNSGDEMIVLYSVFPRFPNVARFENSICRYAFPLQCLFQHARRLENVFFGQHPSAPMDTQSSLAHGVGEDVDGIVWVGASGMSV